MGMTHSDFGALILTHGRPDRVYTHESLRKAGYTGPVVIVIDDEDETAEAYRERFGEEVEVFDKAAIAARIDQADNFEDRRTIVYARNASFEIARRRGFRTFVQLDDDYVDFRHKRDAEGSYIHRADIVDLDAVFDAMLDYYLATPLLSLAMAQGGDFIGGASGSWGPPRRKAMNSLICSVDREFEFSGRINEDVTAYVSVGSRGGLFLTTPWVALQQKQTQATDGGMSEIYREGGTYKKSFYSVMQAPSAVRVAMMGTRFPRIHHRVAWRYAVPKILPEAASG